MGDMPSAVHRAIVCVDVERYADPRRTNLDQVTVRGAVHRSLRAAFARSGIRWNKCHREDRGDGVLVLVPPEVPKNLLVARVPHELAATLAAHNGAHDPKTRIRLRMVVHAGEIVKDAHGVAGTALNVAFRLLEAEPLKRALRGSAGMLAVIASQWFYEEVIRNDPASAPASYRPARISEKETQVTAWICLPDDPYLVREQAMLASAPSSVAPRQLPAAILGFAGRKAELDALTGMLGEESRTGGTVVISAVDGTPGIGKTAIAVQWAHEVADRFPDGQLYVNLRGFDLSGPPIEPSEAVRGFLDALEIPGERIPVSLDAQAALYRSLLAGRRMLVVLDNARDSAQVRPLLPGSAGCVVLVTSRTRLTGLITAEGARPLTVDLLPVAEARQLLARRLGMERVAAEPQAVQEIIAMCAQLPLALSIAAARAASHPAFSLTAMAAELREARGSLQAFTDADPVADLRAVFSWSYHQLTIPAARLFRLLGLHPGPAIGPPAAASLAALPLSQAPDLLAELARAHLVEEPSPGRFTLHDLMRAYAAELAHTHEPDAERRDAVHRVLDHYLHTAHAAARFLHPRMDLAITTSRRTGVTSQEFADPEEAWAWFETEYPGFMDVIRLAADGGWNDYAWQFPVVLEEYLDRRGYRHDCLAAQRIALAAARDMEDRHGQACAHYGLGRVFHWHGDFGKARKHLEQALALFEEPSEKTLKAHAHVELSHVFEHQARLDEAVYQAFLDKALDHARLALTLARATGNRRAEARALHFAGKYHTLLGDYHQGLGFSQQALILNREVGDRRSEGCTLNGIGYAYHRLGQYDQAIAYYQQELDLKSQLADRYSQAVTFTNLGDTYHAAGNDEAARSAWQHALDILEDFGNADAGATDAGHVRPGQVLARLRGLGNVELGVHL